MSAPQVHRNCSRVVTCFTAIAASLAASLVALSAAAQVPAHCGSGPVETWVTACSPIIDNPSESIANRVQALIYRGTAFRHLGNAGNALADYTAATAADPDNAAAWLDRGAVLMEKGEIADALASFDKTIALNPQSVEAYNNRGAAESQNGDFARAAADLDTALRLGPGSEAVYGNRGFVRLALGDFAGAAADFAALLARDRSDPYRLLWLQLARMRAGIMDDEFAKEAAALASSPWPGPVLALYAGSLDRTQVMAMDADVAGADRDERRCEVVFYVGEHVLAKGDALTATALLREAASACPVGFLERAAAIGELKRLQP